jgi:glucans biosynthesis protein C
MSSSRAGQVDALRIALIGGVVVFHATRPFDPFDFYVKADTEVAALAPVVLFVGLWGMPLFFALAGAAAWHSLGRRGVRTFARERVARLLVPFLAGVVLLVPPQLHAEALAQGRDVSYLDTLTRFFDVHLSWELPIPVDGPLFEPAHLWFLAYLFVFTLMLLPLFHRIRRGGLGERLAWIEAHPAVSMLVLGAVVVLAEAILRTEDAGGWNRWAYPPFLLLGFLLVARPALTDRLATRRRLVAAAGLLGFVVLVVTGAALHDRIGEDFIESGALGAVLWRAGKGAAAWLLVLAIAATVLRRTTHDHAGEARQATGRWAGVAREGVLPVYMLHQTVAVVFAAWVVSWHTSPGVQWLALTALTVTVTLALFAALRQLPVARTLLGMRSPVGTGRAARTELGSRYG